MISDAKLQHILQFSKFFNKKMHKKENSASLKLRADTKKPPDAQRLRGRGASAPLGYRLATEPHRGAALRCAERVRMRG